MHFVSQFGSSPQRPALTIEVFPPAKPEGIDSLAETVRRLGRLEPEFISVTYGAGGSTRERSLGVVRRLLDETGGKVAAHVTCVACTAEETDQVVGDFVDMGVRRFFALRGDVPGTGQKEGSYADATCLVRALSNRGIEDVFVAAYPEVHPKAISAEADLDTLKAKLDAGAKRAVTQFFLDNEAFYRFRDKLADEGIGQPLVPGVLLFEDFSRAVNFAERCGTVVPQGLKQRFAEAAENGVSPKAEAARFLSEQIADLSAHGVDRFHLYALNRSEMALEVFDAAGQECPLTAAA